VKVSSHISFKNAHCGKHWGQEVHELSLGIPCSYRSLSRLLTAFAESGKDPIAGVDKT
jgi:hypothetical protein